MATSKPSFDPYHKWLGIPPKDQPPNFYRLLGIELFESEPEVTEAAYNRQMSFIRACAAGTHAEDADRLLNELAAARLCLLNPQKRHEYDAQLKSALNHRDKPTSTVVKSRPLKGSRRSETLAPVQKADYKNTKRTGKSWLSVGFLVTGLAMVVVAAPSLWDHFRQADGRVAGDMSLESRGTQIPATSQVSSTAASRSVRSLPSTTQIQRASAVAVPVLAATKPSPIVTAAVTAPATTSPSKKIVKLRLVVHAPADTPADATLDIRGYLPQLGQWCRTKQEWPLLHTGHSTWTADVELETGSRLEYRISGGSEETIEELPDHGVFSNRILEAGAEDRDEEIYVQSWAKPLKASPISPKKSDQPARIDSVKARQNRQAGEAVLKLGGSVFIDIEGERKEFKGQQSLPTTSFVIKGVHFNHTGSISNTDVSVLANLKDLESLDIAATKITDEALVHVRTLTGLKELRLGGTPITNNGLRLLGPLRKLEILGLYYTQVTDDGMQYLRDMVLLKEINLGGTKVSDKALKRVRPNCQIVRP